ncbi:MAG: hypothetical protein FWG70_05930 [Oscillospiraceae bacterium]|nr:hypothetical protein [Oscillospiraceae bacterium]
MIMREFLLNVSLVAAATALFRMLVPETGFKKQIGFLISCFFISVTASFFMGGNLEIEGVYGVDFDTGGSITDFSEQATLARKQAIAEEVSARINEILQQNGIYPSEISVIVNISGLYSISINEIKLVLPPDADFGKASALIEKEVGTDIKVIITAI